MTVIAELIEEAAKGETIVGAVIGPHYSDYDGDPFNSAPIGELLSWGEAKPFLSYEYNSDWGGAECHPVYAWTATKVIVIIEFDGRTWVVPYPRHPLDTLPSYEINS